jgi:hypothetical protein
VVTEDPSDLSTGARPDVLGLPPRFNKNLIVTDAFFIDTVAIDADAMQAFFETTPYGRHSWLADEMIDGRRAADAIVQSSSVSGINPIIVLARMQVEQSAISRTTRPSTHDVDYAFGCGCPDGSSCDPEFKGLDKQVSCAADTLRGGYEASRDGSGEWLAGRAHTSSDHFRVIPEDSATASLYAYTPWVLPGRGGNWLVWDVTRRYASFFAEAGKLNYTAP